MKSSLLDRVLQGIKRAIPGSIFSALAPSYHRILAYTGALVYGFPSHSIKVIGITGTKGKSTTALMLVRMLEASGHRVAMVGSLGYQIADQSWPNTLKMTMPGRWKLQKFLRQAVAAGCQYAVMEVPSEGLAQGRHLGITFDAAVFLNIHPEHIESHGSYEAYRDAKRLLFRVTRRLHVINTDSPEGEYLAHMPAKKVITCGIEGGLVRATHVSFGAHGASFQVNNVPLKLYVGGRFNVSNAITALAVAYEYGVTLQECASALEHLREVPGRMQWIQTEPFGVVIDYAHTPESLEAVYATLRPQAKHLIAVLGSAGGGRDRWKRPKFGSIASSLCDIVILTNEDPFDEDPQRIVDEIESGMAGPAQHERIMDRGQAIERALTKAQPGDIVIITGKGSETSIAGSHGLRTPWSDAEIARVILSRR
jgi:UDP-N-acetylmuramoyl-L-alanyl-D-glutamate--2,6-diaminopimelate ligase